MIAPPDTERFRAAALAYQQAQTETSRLRELLQVATAAEDRAAREFVEALNERDPVTGERLARHFDGDLT